MTLVSPRPRLFTALVAAASVVTSHAFACDACNLNFADEFIDGARSNTLIGADLRRAMENQRDLPIEGFSSPLLIDVQNSKIKSAAPRSSSSTTIQAVRTPAAPSPAPDLAKPAHPLPDYLTKADFIEIIQRDHALPTRPYSTVPQDTPADKTFTIRLHEGSTYIGNGVVYEGFLIDGKIPGPTLYVDEGDVVEFNVSNEGTIPHGASIHSAYTQTSKYVGSIMPGESKRVAFRANTPGVFMYHCAPGGHAIPMHVLAGQYGMMVVRPKGSAYRLEQELGHPPNVELSVVQHELYASGHKAIKGDPDYTLFNGRLFRYVEEPIKVKPGDYVRINFLNVGPNQLSTFHFVGIIWDYIYWQGHPEAIMPGGQTVTAGPSDSFVIEFRMPPDKGAYTMLTHAVGSASRGAIGLLVVDDEADTPEFRRIDADGPVYPEEQLAEYIADATRKIAPFGIGTHPVDRPVVHGPETKEVNISIMGNSFHPKVIQVAPGTKVTWTNEDVFTYLGGEFSGIHNAVAIAVPEGAAGFATPMLAHAESYSHEFGEEGEFGYICAPHPYMKGKVIVKSPGK